MRIGPRPRSESELNPWMPLLVLFFGREVLYPWVLKPIPVKAAWLNTPFFFLRTLALPPGVVASDPGDAAHADVALGLRRLRTCHEGVREALDDYVARKKASMPDAFI